ncbi:translation initiation factor IF2 [Schizosaccharomyces japonicus yFS275]|uniref:Eukaryotic translation initiation factor 5B n=1 Tax=Schizosaccharomyces japonicus (strain yFS275 / FY16936) TaxID=402676 RepID=B6K2T4_SCHJY|nr:translation initiation factor IF2 [Schizosaccharomyces japonicus yFS275]EEB08574.1 translation initiation factor IF2 [Schizosaccharomyces japonicus yFS275]
MGKKGKKNAYADWEDDLGTDISGQNAYKEPEPVEEEVEEKMEKLDLTETAPSKKKKGKKGKKNTPSPPVEEELEEPEEPVKTGPVELTAGVISEDEFAPIKPKKNKKKKANKVVEPVEEEVDVAVPEIRIKSKKEKERERKEREKLRKKQQQAAKKGTPSSQTPVTGTSSPLDSSATEESATPKEAPVKTGKGKRKGPNVAALQKMLEQQRAREEELKREKEEEERRIAEEQRRLEEEERKKEEAKQRKKEKEKRKKEELKAQGKYLTKKQKEAMALAERRKKQMLEAGYVVAGLAEKAEGEKKEKKKKKPVYDNRKRSGKSNASSASSSVILTPTTTEAQTPSETPASPVPSKLKEEEKAAEDEAMFDSWEAALDEPEPASWEEQLQEEEKPTEDSKSSEDSKAKAKDGKKETKNDVDAIPEAEGNTDSNVSSSNMRSPICCILGHVDTGKTKLLDNLRRSNVQEGEAGGITQQIGATYFPIDALKEKVKVMEKESKIDYQIPGLLIIDTPGHESFTNLRSRGSSLCNIAILVIDIMHGLEPQTIESIRLLRERKTPFIVALNKVDRLYGWHSIKDNAFQDSLKKQKKAIQREFQDRVKSVILQLNEQGLNAALYYENKNMGRYVSLVPTSAVSGEGVPDLLKLLITLTQSRMSENLKYLSKLECTVLEVKVIEGLGATVDVVLSNGVLREGDRIILCGMSGPIITTVRALLTPQPLKEMRIKSAYVHHKEIKAAMGVKICANDLDKAVAGSRLLVVGPDDDEEELADEIMEDLEDLLGRIDTSGVGVSVQASTLGSLEALLEFLKQMEIPVSSVSVGPVYKKDIMRSATMLEKAPEYAIMLCFDVKIDKDAEELAEQMGIKIFSANIIYHLFDAFTAHQKQLMEKKREEGKGVAVFPCVLRTVAAFNKRDPIILGVDVVEGILRTGTPIVAVKPGPDGENQVVELGTVASIESNHKPVEKVKKGQAGAGVAVKLESNGSQILFGRQVDEKDMLYSHISRRSIDALKDPAFRNEVSREEWQLIIQLKKVFGII